MNENDYILERKFNTIRFDILKEFIDKLSNYVNKKYKYELTIESNDEDLSLFDDYYKNIYRILDILLIRYIINTILFTGKKY